jgi:hypothetical protein
MNIHWAGLLSVFLVSLASAVAVVVLVGLALVGLSARTAVADGPARRSRVAGTAAAGACLTAAAMIVLAGLWAVVAK